MGPLLNTNWATATAAALMDRLSVLRSTFPQLSDTWSGKSSRPAVLPVDIPQVGMPRSTKPMWSDTVVKLLQLTVSYKEPPARQFSRCKTYDT